MKHSDEILEELQAVSPYLAAMPRGNPYVVPVGYFESLPAAITAESEDKILFNSILNIAYSVPENYFEGLAQNIMTKIAITEEDNLSEEAPILYSLTRQPVYSVPEGYFAQVIPIPGAKTKVVAIKSYRRVIQYAAAAMVSGILVTGAFMYTDSHHYVEQEKAKQSSVVKSNETVLLKDAEDNKNDTVNEVQAEETVADISQPAIENGTQDLSKKIQLLSEEEMKKYLEENAVPEPMQPETTQVILEDTTGL